MKTILTSIFALLISTMMLSQTKGINYKAVIKDNLGNVVANDLVVVQFTILKGVAQTNVYRENHTPTTNANGIVIVNIGEGTLVSGNFNTIIWSNDTYSLNTQINTGSGLVDMGTTEIKAVPYALNVTGLEALDEGNGVGLRIIGRNPVNYGNIGNRAMDLSYSSSASTTKGATGNYSTTMGLNTTASYLYATSMGLLTVASGGSSVAMGLESVASGDLTLAFGESSNAQSYNSSVFGRFNSGGGNPTTWIETDPLFEIGNGTSTATRTNALTILKNGTITAPSFEIAEITNAKALITKEYLDANGATGLEAINEGNGIGWRLKGRNPAYYGNIGSNSVDLSESPANSTTFGPTGNNSLTLGKYTTAVGDSSLAMGFGTIASGVYSLAMGVETKANSVLTFASGRYNVGGGDYLNWNATDPLFEIGNGTSNANRANALTVLKNGNVGIGIANPTAKLQLNGRVQFGDIEYIEDAGSFYIAVNGSLNSTGNGLDNLGSASHRWNTVYALNGTINTSDRRDKTNINEMNYGLKDLMKLKPVSFNWKNNPNEDKKLGLIAQDLLQVIPEVVKTHENVIIDENDRTKTKSVEMDRMGVYYSDLIPVLIKSIQEQQTIIESLKARIEVLENK